MASSCMGYGRFPVSPFVFAARRAGKPYGIFVHGALDPWFYRNYPLKHLKKMLYWPMQYPVLRDALAVFFTAESERDLAKISFRPNTWNSAVVGLGITDPEECPNRSIRTNRDVLPQISGASRTPLFAVPGPDSREEGLRFAPRGIRENRGLCPGRGPCDRRSRSGGNAGKASAHGRAAGIAGRVHWPGFIDGDLKWGALRACEAFVLSSHSENFGIAVVESLAVGRPVLISNRVNIWPEIESDGAGLVDDDTLEGTERLLRRWFNLPRAERDAMAARARRSFVGRYTMNQTALAIENVFSPVASLPDRATAQARFRRMYRTCRIMNSESRLLN